ncbi:uncharacterized protein [Diadema setosum]|uniref:uncharacterized protein n=1 Tax=Diadema setosum TaxID=31175 RepID=UPI003B3B6B73
MVMVEKGVPETMATHQQEQTPTAARTGQDEEKIRRNMKRLRVAGILQLCGTVVLLACGIAAIVIQAYYSYYATPIWSAVVVYGPGGILAVVSSYRMARSPVIASIIFSSGGVAMSLALLFIYSLAIEGEGNQYLKDKCQPSAYKHLYGCRNPMAARRAVDSIILATAFFLVVVDIASIVIGGIHAHKSTHDATSKRCASCCCICCACSPPPPTAAMFATNGQDFPQVGLYTQGIPQVYMVGQQGTANGEATPIQSIPGNGGMPHQGQTVYVINANQLIRQSGTSIAHLPGPDLSPPVNSQ